MKEIRQSFRPNRNRMILLPVLVLAIVVLISLCTGAYHLSMVEIGRTLYAQLTSSSQSLTDENSTAFFLLWNIRLPRVLMAILVGSGLAVSGATIQTIFRNPLADPTLIGVSSGAMLFAVFFIVLQSYLPFVGEGFSKQLLLAAFAFGGGLLTTALVYRLSSNGRKTNIATMLLAGIAITALCGGLTGLLIYYADESQLRDITFWNLGSLSGGSWSVIALIGTITLLATFKISSYSKELEIMQLGDQEATYLGVPIEHIKRKIIVLVCLIVGCSVAFTGLIGFVGLMVPHLVRLHVSKIGFKQLIWLSSLVGSILLLLADTLARTIISPSELPIGILTALMGSPFFLWLLIKNKY